MLLKVVVASPVGANTPFTFTVPGHETWRLRSVLAVCSRGTGGTPNRAYTLSITDGTHTVARTVANDAGTEPGTCTITYADVTSNAVASGSIGTSVGPLPKLACPSGYVITGAVVAGVVADQWTSAVAWVDYMLT